MKKTFLPLLVLFLSFLIFSIVSPSAHAQPENVATCEEWKDIYGTETCRNAVHWPDKKDIWCYDPKEAESYPGGTGKYVGDYLLYRPPTHIVAFDYDACIQEWGKEKGYSGLPETESETQSIETPLQEKKSVVQSIEDWIMENELVADPSRIEQMEKERNETFRKTAQLKEDMFKKAQETWKSEMIKLQAEALVEPTFEFLWEGQWPDVKSVVLDAESGVIIASDSWRNIYLQDLADQITKKVILSQGEMEVKVINEKPAENNVRVEVDDFFDIFVIQTHFRVAYDPDKKQGVINVYEGEVEVKTKDGKTITVKPNGDKPGVVVLTRKLLGIRLMFASLTLGGILGGALIVKRKRRLPPHRKLRS